MLSVERRTVDVVSLAGRAVSAVTAPPRRVTGRQPDRCARVGARRVPLELRGREGGGPSQLAAAVAMHFEWSRKAKRWRWWASLVLVVDAAGGNDSCPLEVRRGRAMTREQK